MINRPAVALGLPKTPIVPTPESGLLGDPLAGQKFSIDDYYLNKIPAAKPQGFADIPLSSFYTGSRFPESRPYTDVEEMAAQQQSAWDQWGNGLTKTIGTFASSFVSGTAGLVYGIGSAAVNHRWASLIDNDVTRNLDRFSNYLEE
jgi:hypothetical protein